MPNVSGMFGRLRVSQCQLATPEKDAYNADFCSMCHSLRAQDGLLSTLLTNYDNTFWLQVAAGLMETKPLLKKPCTAMPLRSVSVRLHSPQVERSNISLLWLLVKAKAEDDLHDEQSLKAKLILRYSGQKVEKAKNYLASLGFAVGSLLDLPEKQREAESDPVSKFLDVSLPTEEMMGEIFAHLATVCERPLKAFALRDFGRNLGRALYLMDALEDYTEDQAAGRFNPVFRSAGVQSRSELSELVSLVGSELSKTAVSLDLTEPSVTVVNATLRRLISRLTRHALVIEAKKSVSVGSLGPRRRDVAAFCKLQPPEDPKERCCSCCKECDCGGCECCCELPDCAPDCGNGGCCDCGGCDCGGCDCGGCDCGGCACSKVMKFWNIFKR